MKIILANLPWNGFFRTGVRAGSRWPHLKGPTEKDYLPFPFFLAYAAALLKKNNFQVQLIDAIAQEKSYRRFLADIRKIKPQLIVCETSTVTLDHDLRLLEKIGQNVPIVVCGPDINIRQPAFLDKYPFITYVLVGEYEFTLLELVRHLELGKSLEGITGLIYRSTDGIKINPPRPLVDLDNFPWPLRQGLPLDKYNDTPGDMPVPSAQMLASRGCPYKCKFCLWPQVMYQSNAYRVRNVADVVDEMEYLVKEMGFKSIYFDDDTFNCGKDRMLELCDEIKKRNLNIPWAIMARADLMTEEILEQMRSAGLFAIKYGVESAKQELLDNISKGMDLKKTENIIRFTKMLEIRTHLTFTFGLPGETKESILKTIDLALKLDPTTVQFSIATPFPGTSFYDELREKGYILSENWAEYDGNHKSVIKSNNISQRDLEDAIKYAYKQWGLHCAKRNLFRNTGYSRLIMNSLKKYGFFITCYKIWIFLARRLTELIRSGVFYRQELEKKVAKNGLKAGRLMLYFDAGKLCLYWDGMKLTKGQGFINLFTSLGKQLDSGHWHFQKVSDSELLLVRRQDSLGLEEAWKIEVVDEKQIDWDILALARQQINGLESKTMLVLSGKYHTWLDSWGEGRFYPIDNYRKVELRNSNSDFIGLRGRKKLRGQLPTIFWDLSSNNGRCRPAIKNDSLVLGARVLKARIKAKESGLEQSQYLYNLFSGRIKIVEEDFSKRKVGKRNERQ
jgi:anaerobic magnesium-protoporphyrin IX monomethyl ester cyclase